MAEPYLVLELSVHRNCFLPSWRFFCLHGTRGSCESLSTAPELSACPLGWHSGHPAVAWPRCLFLTHYPQAEFPPPSPSIQSPCDRCASSLACSKFWLQALFCIQRKPAEQYRCQQAASASQPRSLLPLLPTPLLLILPSPTVRFPLPPPNPSSSSPPTSHPHPTKSSVLPACNLSLISCQCWSNDERFISC